MRVLRRMSLVLADEWIVLVALAGSPLRVQQSPASLLLPQLEQQDENDKAFAGLRTQTGRVLPTGIR